MRKQKNARSVHGKPSYMTDRRSMGEKRKFPRVPVRRPVVCFRYGKEMTMRTLNISLGGLKLEANFDLHVGESVNLAILTNGIRIPCKGRVLAIEDLKHKVHVRLCFANISDMGLRQLSNYLDRFSLRKVMPLEKWVIGGVLALSAYIAYLLIRGFFLQ